MNDLKIAINAQVLPDGRAGGSVQGVVNLIRALSNLTDGHEEYYIISSGSNPYWLNDFLNKSVKICPHPENRWNKWYHLPATLRFYLRPILKPLWNHMGPTFGASTLHNPLPRDPFMDELPVDVIHYPDQRLYQTSKRSIFSPWDLIHEHHPELFYRHDLMYRKAFYPAACGYADAIIVPTAWGKTDLLNHIDINPDRVFVIPQGVATDLYDKPTEGEKNNLRNVLKLPDSFGLYPAQTYPHKNHLRLLEALALLKTQSKLSVKIVCPGYQGEFWPNIANRLKELNLSEFVFFPGFVSHATMRSLYSLADFMIFPTLFEGWGFPIFEAFNEGVPVACSEITCLPELAGDAVLYFDPTSIESIADAISLIASDLDLRCCLSKKGCIQARKYTWERSAKMHRALYRLISNGSASDEDHALLSYPMHNQPYHDQRR